MAKKQKGWYFNASKKDDKTATIVIEGTIGGYNWDADTWAEFIQNRKNAFRKNIKKLINEGVTKIYVDIDSLGGLLNHGLVIHDLLAGFKGEVITTTYGMTASAATIIHQAASEGKRRISANSFYLIHKAMIPAGYANSNELRQMLIESDKMDNTIKNIYKRNTVKKNAKKIDALMEEQNGNGIWLDAYEVVGYGLADEVLEPSEGTTVNWKGITDMANDMKLPEIPQELINRVKNYSGSVKQKTESTKKSFWNMGFLKEVVEALKEKGLKIVNSDNQEVTEEQVENGLTEEQITGITNSVVGNALDPLKEQISNLQTQISNTEEEETEEEEAEEEVQEEETTNTQNIENVVANAVAKALADAGFDNKKKGEEEKALNKQIKELQGRVKNLSKAKSKESAANIKMAKASNGAGLDIEAAEASGGFEIEVEVE